MPTLYTLGQLAPPVDTFGTLLGSGQHGEEPSVVENFSYYCDQIKPNFTSKKVEIRRKEKILKVAYLLAE